jgi:Domain of unknown function (DUF4390)
MLKLQLPLLPKWCQMIGLLFRLMALVLCLQCWHQAYAADGIDIREANIELSEDGWLLNTRQTIDLSPVLEDAIKRGMTLPFVADLEISQPRWYWLDAKVLSQHRTIRISYHVITRQYRVGVGSLQQSVGSLKEALAMVGRIAGWQFAERNQLKTGETYQAAFRLQLDTTQLPKPFQINALTSRDWTVGSDWKRWSFNVAAPTEKSEPK